jgi:hypothetical protein
MSRLDEESDEELLRWYQDESTDHNGEPFMVIYMRYREPVRAEMEAAGLTPADAESRVGAVFIRAMNDAQSDGVTLRERLVALARALAADPEWHPPWPVTTTHYLAD